MKKMSILIKRFPLPVIDGFNIWWEVIQGNENQSLLWDDLSFFHLFNENFFEWYDFDSIRNWKFLDDE